MVGHAYRTDSRSFDDACGRSGGCGAPRRVRATAECAPGRRERTRGQITPLGAAPPPRPAGDARAHVSMEPCGVRIREHVLCGRGRGRIEELEGDVFRIARYLQ